MQILKEKCIKATKIPFFLQLFACQIHNKNNMFETKVKKNFIEFEIFQKSPFKHPRLEPLLACKKSSSEL